MKLKLWAKIVVVILALALVGGGIFGIVKLADSGKLDNKVVSDLAFSIGGLDGAGKYMNTDQSIYTKNAFECQGLECSLVFDNNISYQIYFYDQNNDFVHTTGKLTGAFVKDSVPFFAKYARIVITPDDDDKVGKLEVLKYARQLNITVYREQGFKNYTEDLFTVRATGAVLDNSGAVSEQSDVRNVVSDFINIKAYNEVLFFRTSGEDLSSGFKFHLYDSAKTHLGSVCVDNCETIFVSSNGDHYYKIALASLNASTVFISYSTFATNPVHFYCR